MSAKFARRTLVYLGAGLALAGAGAASVAGLAGGTTTAAGSSDLAGRAAESVVGAKSRSADSDLRKYEAPQATKPAKRARPSPGKPDTAKPDTAKPDAAQPAVSARASRQRPTATPRAATPGAANHGAANHGAANHGAANHGAANHGAPNHNAANHKGANQQAGHDETWQQIEHTVAGQTVPVPRHGSLPAQDKLTPTGTSGPQSWMPITPARYENATTIVRQALDKKMGLRSAVIAVATAMQESTLLNINYGDRDSVGLFQQRPSAGWGTAGQILRPVYAADAFLQALRTYQANNPTWANQPLWQPAQGVQASGFPYAYAKWEAQAAQLVGSVTRRLI